MDLMWFRWFVLLKIEPVGASHCVGGNEFLQADYEYSIDAVKTRSRAEKRLWFDVCGLGRNSREKNSLGNVFLVVDTGKAKRYIGIAISTQTVSFCNNLAFIARKH